MHADIFIGVVFYQRLRHMVADKAQVRSTGPIVSMTRQPVKGRKRGGGIRLGEMERDALISHGVAFCLQDRLMHCSDSHLAFVCGTCGSLLTVCPRSHAGLRNASGMYICSHAYHLHVSMKQILIITLICLGRNLKVQYCIKCKSGAGIRSVYLPYVYRFLTNELAAMGVKLRLTLTE